MRKKLQGNQNNIELRELVKIGFEKFYYDISGFSEKDVYFLNQFLQYMQKKDSIKFGIKPEVYTQAAIERDFIEKNVMCIYEGIDNKWSFLDKLTAGDTSFYKDSKGQDLMNKLEKSMIGALFGQENVISEEEAINMVSEFYQDGIEDNDLKYEFNCYFCMQYFRSPRIHNSTVTNIENFKKEKKEFSDISTSFYVNMLAVYFAERMAWNLTRNFNTSILLFENNTDVSFVTGDTPIVNLTGNQMDKMTVLNYPVSPTFAMKLIVIPKFSNLAEVNKNITMELEQELVDVVKNLNQKFAENCVNEIYSNDTDSLNKIRI